MKVEIREVRLCDRHGFWNDVEHYQMPMCIIWWQCLLIRIIAWNCSSWLWFLICY